MLVCCCLCSECWPSSCRFPTAKIDGVKIGDTKIGIQTESSEKLPSPVDVVLLAGGVLALVVGLRKT